MKQWPQSLKKRYHNQTDKTRAARMKWFNEARFGMFIHFGLYSVLGRHEWAMNRERIPLAEYEKLAVKFKPKAGAPMKWAKLAKEAGMKYMVLTTKHHEGFSLWDSKLNPYNSVRLGPQRDIVAEYVKAARHHGLKVGFYYSLMDWHHPDGHACAHDVVARKRFLKYTQGLLHELMSGYGKVDILWYDLPWPLISPDQWDSYRMNDMVRKLQPGIIINDRSQLPEDITTPEEHITPAKQGRGWEACMTFNGAWGFVQTPPEDWHSSRKVLEMLCKCAAGGGNLLLNIGPKADGSIPSEASERLTKVGKWLKKYGAAVYGKKDRLLPMEWLPSGWWTREGNTYYFWCSRWPGKKLAIGGLSEKLMSARILPHGKPLKFEQTDDRLVIKGLPDKCPDKTNKIGVIEMKFINPPTLLMESGCLPVLKPHYMDKDWTSPQVQEWYVSRLCEKENISAVKGASLNEQGYQWHKMESLKADAGMIAGVLCTHKINGKNPGIIHVGNHFHVPRDSDYTFYLGHDSGASIWVDGKKVFCDERFLPPCVPGRSAFEVFLTAGQHEIVIALDNEYAWGCSLAFGIPKRFRKSQKRPVFPAIFQ